MPDSKITALTALTAADPANDMFPVVDVSDTTMAASGTTKRISINNILACSPSATLASATITGDLTVRTTGLVVNASGAGVGVAPSVWNSNYNAIDIGANGSIAGRLGASNTVDTTSNAFRNSAGDWIYKIATSNFAARYQVDGSSGSHIWYNAPTGTAPNIIGWSTLMTLNSTGLGVGGVPTGTGPIFLLEGVAGRYARYDSKVGAKTWSIGYRSGTLQYEIQEDGVERFVIANGGNVGIGVTPSAGKGCLQLSSGINFPATQVASSDVNTLDDYVETTFNPTIVGSTTAGSATYSTQIGRATKVGRLVTFQIRVAYSGGTGTGNLRIASLPFTAGVGSVFAIYAENIALTASNYAVASMTAGNTFISVDQLPTGGGAAAAVPYDAAGDIQISGSYIV